MVLKQAIFAATVSCYKPGAKKHIHRFQQLQHYHKHQEFSKHVY